MLIGINLLREGLDLPEVSLVAILDADKEGFLRSGRRADSDHRPRRAASGRPRHPLRRRDDGQHEARHRRDRPPARRRSCEYNERNNITPQSIIKPIDMSLVAIAEGDYVTVPLEADEEVDNLTPEQRERFIGELEERMREAARKFEFEKAAQLRDRVKALRVPA